MGCDVLCSTCGSSTGASSLFPTKSLGVGTLMSAADFLETFFNNIKGNLKRGLALATDVAEKQRELYFSILPSTLSTSFKKRTPKSPRPNNPKPAYSRHWGQKSIV